MSADDISPLPGSSFGALLRRYREASGLTQEDLAQRAGLSVRGISDLERSRRQTPRHDTVRLIADALDLPPRQRSLLEAAAHPRMDGARPQSAPLPPNNLPAQLTSLLGRERETRLAAELLERADVRLLTLTGPGGVGKTRLALATAEELLERFDDGVFVVSLAARRDPALVLEGILDALGLRTAPGRPLTEQAHELLRSRQSLLVLDNFEHLMAAAPQIAELLAACPRLKALVTSREPLKLSGEHDVPVAPLAPDAASELFVERARAADPGFGLAADERPVVAAICERVDRLPLAIELAAGWVRVLPLPALLERLNSRLDLLRDGRRDAPERQRTLRGAIAWSVDLLPPQERRLFQRLAVFVGGCALDAAEAICADAAAADAADTADTAAATAAPNDLLDGLARLVEKSLLQAEMTPEGTRFTLLETLREYALEQLVASGEAEALRRQHAEYYARLVAELGWIGADQDARDQRLERELPNARAALAWALERERPGLGLRLATPLGRWWYSRGAFDEGESWLRALLALDAQGGEHAAAPQLRSAALYALVLFALDRRQYDEAEAMAREGLALARQQGDVARAGNMLAELGHVAEARGDLDGAMAYFEDALAQYQQGGEGAAVGRTLSSLGNLARATGDYTRARSYLEQALAWARARNFSFAVASGLVSLGHVACEQGDYSGALALYRESLGLYQHLRNQASLAWCLVGVAVAVAATGAYETTARVCGAVTALRESTHAAETAEWPPYARAMAAARGALGAERFAEAYAAGHALTVEQAIAGALVATAAR